MNQEGQTQLGFGQATGRMSVCPSCRKPLPRPESNQFVLICSYCRTETALEPPLSSMNSETFRVDLIIDKDDKERTVGITTKTYQPEHSIEGDAMSDEFELKLEPESERVPPTSAIQGWQVNPASASVSLDQYRPTFKSTLASTDLDLETRAEQAKLSYNESAGLYPKERHYPTLEAMQRLYKLFGYVAVLVVFPYIGIRFLYLLVITRERHLQVFAEFSEFAVPVLFGCVALTASLFAASEGIRLAMDIQDNTLRIANSSGRRKEK
jgi:hypothetical protein